MAPGFSFPPLVLGTYAGPPLSNENQTGFYDLVLSEAFRRIGRRVEIVSLPAERSLLNADSGITDGDFVRIAGLERLYPNLIKVPEAIIDFEFVAFARNLELRTDSWDALQPYDVAIVRGWKILEENASGSHSLLRTNDQWQLFNLLRKDRVDIVIYSRFEGQALISAMGIEGAKPLEPPLAMREMYLYLNNLHRELVPPLAGALRAMKADNTYRTLRERALGPYLK